MRLLIALVLLMSPIASGKEDLMQKFREKETQKDLKFKQGLQDLRQDPQYQEYENPLEHQESKQVAQEPPKEAPEPVKSKPQTKETYAMSKDDAEAMGKMMMQSLQGLPPTPGQILPKNK